MPKVNWTRKRNHLAELLRAYKQERKITSVVLGKTLGISPEAVRKQLTKPVDRWTIGQIKRYCDILSVPYEEAVLAAIQK